jgi:hypothetical protein
MALITISDLEAHLQQALAFSANGADAAQAAIDDASGAVNGYKNLASHGWDATTCPDSVKLVVKRVAGRLLTNPQQRTNYTGPDGLNYTGGPVRLLTDDEREQLDVWVPRSTKVGMIRMTAAPWSVPQ